jgi:hypothetical protein
MSVAAAEAAAPYSSVSAPDAAAAARYSPVPAPDAAAAARYSPNPAAAAAAPDAAAARELSPFRYDDLVWTDAGAGGIQVPVVINASTPINASVAEDVPDWRTSLPPPTSTFGRPPYNWSYVKPTDVTLPQQLNLNEAPPYVFFQRSKAQKRAADIYAINQRLLVAANCFRQETQHLIDNYEDNIWRSTDAVCQLSTLVNTVNDFMKKVVEYGQFSARTNEKSEKTFLTALDYQSSLINKLLNYFYDIFNADAAGFKKDNLQAPRRAVCGQRTPGGWCNVQELMPCLNKQGGTRKCTRK